jgi:hypothetical protein
MSWPPRTLETLRAALAEPDLAVDVAAMTVEGGVLFYGIAEQEGRGGVAVGHRKVPTAL